jgi:hypothetical protein
VTSQVNRGGVTGVTVPIDGHTPRSRVPVTGSGDQSDAADDRPETLQELAQRVLGKGYAGLSTAELQQLAAERRRLARERAAALEANAAGDVVR